MLIISVEAAGSALISSPRSLLQGLDDAVANKNTGNGRISASETFAYSLDVGNNSLLLPRMHRARSAHSAHYLVKHQKRSILVAYGFHGFKVSLNRRNAAKCLR